MVAQTIKNPPASQETWVRSLSQEDPPGVGNGNPLQYSYLESSCGQKSLGGYSPWGHKESDMAEQLNDNNLEINVCSLVALF